MTTNIKLWQWLLERLERKTSCVLYVVTAAEKGSPGNPGFAMAVALKHSFNAALGRKILSTEIFGSIGGGIMEQNLRDEAKEALRSKQSLHFLRKLYHHKSPKIALFEGTPSEGTPSEGTPPEDDFSQNTLQESGLICAGSQTIVACTLTKNDVKTIRRILFALQGPTFCMLKFSARGLRFRNRGRIHVERLKQSRFVLINEDTSDWECSEIIPYPDIVVIAGGGHIGLALSRQMAILGFHVVVVDDREALETLDQNTFANVRIQSSYKYFGNMVAIQKKHRCFVVIATASYKTDVEALLSLAQMNPSSSSFPDYIGLMGSKAKITTIFRDLRLAGISEEWIRAIHAPIGVQINSDTPEEIAVSIAAELIALKNSAEK